MSAAAVVVQFGEDLGTDYSAAPPPQQCTASTTLELETKVRKDFTITEKAPTRGLSTRIRP